MNQELPDVQGGFWRDRGPRDQIANICWIMEKARDFQKNIYFCFIDYAKAFVWIKTHCRKLLKRWEYQTTLPASWETYMWTKKQQLEPDTEQLSGSKLGRELQKRCILTAMQSNLCKMPGWMNHKLETRWPGEASTVLDMQMIPL